MRQSTTYSLHQPQGNKEHGTERSGYLYKKSDGSVFDIRSVVAGKNTLFDSFGGMSFSFALCYKLVIDIENINVLCIVFDTRSRLQEGSLRFLIVYSRLSGNVTGLQSLSLKSLKHEFLYVFKSYVCISVCKHWRKKCIF